jgi:hypothetical protein
MNTPQNKVLAIPPHPPAPANTGLWAVGGLVLSVGASTTFFSIPSFPHNAPVESGFAWISSVVMFSLAFTLGLRALMNETKRKQFQHIVTTYTNMTGDKRYLPYMLPVRAQLVTILFVISMAISFLFPLMSLMMESNAGY